MMQIYKIILQKILAAIDIQENAVMSSNQKVNEGNGQGSQGKIDVL